MDSDLVSQPFQATELKDLELVSRILDENKIDLELISKEIWQNPELKLNEVRAHGFLSKTLKKLGFHVEEHYILPTAFRAEFKCIRGDDADAPTIAFLCEYDALPGIGHGCGHNLIAEAGIAAAVGVKHVLEADTTLSAKILVLGCPGEEGGCGKLRLLEGGAFEGVDAALMVHPAKVNSAFPPFLCIVRAKVTYKGKEAHAAAYPWEGRNALDAAVSCYVSIGLLRQQVKPDCRIHGIITKGGSAPNVIPSEAAMEFYIRAPTLKDTKELQERVRQCFESAASSSGCQVEYKFYEEDSYTSVVSNTVLASLYQRYSQMLGIQYSTVNRSEARGSTDMGNVSRVVPSIHPFFAICSDSGNHTKEFTEAAGSSSAQPPTMIASKSMAMVALRVLRSSDLQNLMKDAFVKQISEDN